MVCCWRKGRGRGIIWIMKWRSLYMPKAAHAGFVRDEVAYCMSVHNLLLMPTIDWPVITYAVQLMCVVICRVSAVLESI